MFKLLETMRKPKVAAPTVDEMDAVAKKYRDDRDHWRERAIAAEAKIAKMIAPLKRANAERAARARAANH